MGAASFCNNGVWSWFSSKSRFFCCKKKRKKWSLWVARDCCLWKWEKGGEELQKSFHSSSTFSSRRHGIMLDCLCVWRNKDVMVPHFVESMRGELKKERMRRAFILAGILPKHWGTCWLWHSETLALSLTCGLHFPQQRLYDNRIYRGRGDLELCV